MSMNSSLVWGMGSSMQVFGGDCASTRRTSSSVYSLKPVNSLPLDDEYVGGSPSAVAARTSSTFIFMNVAEILKVSGI